MMLVTVFRVTLVLMTLFWHNLWQVLGELAPWLLLGALISGMLHAILPPGFILRHLGRPGLLSIVKAAALGVPLPLCSCGVIPTGIGLKREGASDGAAIGFLISTPQTGVDSITVSAAFLGWPFAIFKVVSALLTGVVGGVLVDRFAPTPNAKAPIVTAAAPRRSLADRVRLIFSYGFGEMLYMIWRWVLFGVVVSALISTLVPPDALKGTWAGHPLIAMLGIVVIAVPLYVCAVSSVPIAAALVAAGLPAGAALVFLMAGPAVNAATIGAVFRAFGRKVTALYLATIIGGSMLLGMLFDFVLTVKPAATQVGHQHGGEMTITSLLAIIVLGLLCLGYAWRDLRDWQAGRANLAPPAVAEDSRVLVVKGMTCQGCVGHLRSELLKVAGVTAVDVDLPSGRTQVRGLALAEDALRAGVARAGFTCG